MNLRQLHQDKQRLQNSIAILNMKMHHYEKASAHGCVSPKTFKLLAELKSQKDSLNQQLEEINHKILECMAASHR